MSASPSRSKGDTRICREGPELQISLHRSRASLIRGCSRRKRWLSTPIEVPGRAPLSLIPFGSLERRQSDSWKNEEWSSSIRIHSWRTRANWYLQYWLKRMERRKEIVCRALCLRTCRIRNWRSQPWFPGQAGL